MLIDVENKIVKIENQEFEIPEKVIEMLEGDPELTGDHSLAAKKFLKSIDAKRVGFNGLKVGNYYEFIFKIDGDKVLDSHTDRYELLTTIDLIPVRIGTVSEFAILIIGCNTPCMKSCYVDNDMFHYISISFTCQKNKVGAVFQYARSLVNRVLSKGNSFLSPDDVFKPIGQSEDFDDVVFDEPSLSELIDELLKIQGGEYKSGSREKLFSLISKSYHHEESKRFFSYFKILEYLARKQKIENKESKISKFLCNIEPELKSKVVDGLEGNVKYDDLVEYMRNLRNMIIHPTVKIKSGIPVFPVKTVLEFQMKLITNLTGFSL